MQFVNFKSDFVACDIYFVYMSIELSAYRPKVI